MESEFNRSVKGQDVYSESGAEFVLPDYNNDVRKILYSEARVRPGGKFVGSDEVEFTGAVVYNVIYSDSEGKIGGVMFSSDYDYSLKNSSEKLENVIADTRISNFALRLISPRKLSAKCSLASSHIVTERCEYAPFGSAFEEGGGAEERKQDLLIKNTVSSEALEREYAEELCRLDGAIEDEVKIVFSKAYVNIEEASYEENAVLLKGELVMSAVVENADEPAYLVEKRKMIEESIPFEAAAESMKFIPIATVVSERANVRADEEGCEVNMDVIVEFSVIGEENRVLTVISDAFSTECAVENSYGEICYTELIDIISATEKHTEKLSRQDALDGVIRELIYVNAEPKIETAELCDGGVKISGDIKFSGVASEINDDGTTSYTSLKNSSHFEQNVNVNCQNSDKIKLEVKCKALNTEANVDASTIFLSTDIETDITVLEDKSEKALLECSLKKDESYASAGASVSVYYPEAGETLFSVAKKFHVSVNKLCENNTISVETAALGDALVLENKRLLIY